MKYVLEAIDITKKFPGVVANDNVSINVRPGEVLGLIGENGAGKSTLLKVLNGIYPHGSYSGILKIDGEEIKPANPSDSMHLGIGYVPQEINVLKFSSVAENIYMADLKLDKPRAEAGLTLKKDSLFVNFREMYAATEALLTKSNITLDPRADVRKLSIGQQQMLMIARALATSPKVLILDEPTTSLSDKDVKQLFDVVRMLKSKGTSIIFVTHKLAEIMELADRVTILRDGKNISTYEREQFNSGTIIHDMIGRELKNLYVKEKADTGAEVLRVENLTISHPYIANKNLVENISFSVHEGEVLGMAGLVGAGRSEVCMALFGMLPIHSGTIYINGKKTMPRSSSMAMRKGIGMVSEDRKKYGLNFVWDIADNVTVSNLPGISKAGIVSKSKLRSRAKVYFDKLRIKATSIRTMVNTLSGGNQQKVVIARSLNAEPKIVILDEPTKGIDVGSKNEIYGHINEMAKEGKAIIMISSELPELMAMSDRFIVLAEGRVAGELNKEDATEASIMELAVKTFKSIA